MTKKLLKKLEEDLVIYAGTPLAKNDKIIMEPRYFLHYFARGTTT